MACGKRCQHVTCVTKCCCLSCRSVNLERITQANGTEVANELCEKDPQLPQGFTPLKTDIVIKPGDTLKATCIFDSTSVKRAVNAGATHNDEMCNLYLMLYSQLPYFMACYRSPQVEKHGMGGIPLEGRIEVRLLCVTMWLICTVCYYPMLAHSALQHSMKAPGWAKRCWV